MTAQEDWIKRLEKPRNDIEDLFLAMRMFLDMQQLMQNNAALQRRDYYHTYQRRTYVAHISVLLRRNLRRSSQSYSFLNFLDSVATETKRANKAAVLADISEIERYAALCVPFFDKDVVHLDKQQPEERPKYDDLHASILLLTDLCKKYSMSLLKEQWWPEEKEIGNEWLTIFDGAWYVP
jgi:hypothetical protein